MERRAASEVAVLAVVALLTLAVLASAGGVAAGVERSEAAATGSESASMAREAGVQVEPDDVLLGVRLHADGNATWRVEYRMRLATQNETQAFEELAADVRQNPGEYTTDFARRMRATVRAAENDTGREMRVLNVTVSAEKRQLPQSYGVVTYRFTWTNFATVDGPRLRAGDALSQLFLDNETTLLFEWPARYRVAQVSPPPSDRRPNAVVWTGPLEFTPGQPALVVTSAATSTGTPGPTPPGGGSGGLPLLLLAALSILLAVGVAFGLHRRGWPAGRSTEPDTGGAEPAGAEELLSSEERVMELLRDHGGRMKQKQLADELDWSAARTSQVVGSLREEDEVETFRLGRENVVALSEDEE